MEIEKCIMLGGGSISEIQKDLQENKEDVLRFQIKELNDKVKKILGNGANCYNEIK